MLGVVLTEEGLDVVHALDLTDEGEVAAEVAHEDLSR